MTLPSSSARNFVACLFIAACADEAALDETLDETLDEAPDNDVTGGASQALAVERNLHCRHWRGCVVDVCARDNGGCSQTCVSNDAGSRTCGCQPGWTLQGNGTSCRKTPVQTFTVKGVAGKGGSVVASSPTGTCSNAGVNWSCTVPAGGAVVVNALPADTWQFAGWHCPQGVAAGEAMSIGNVHADSSDCFASFMPVVFEISYYAVDATGAHLPGAVTAYDATRGPCEETVCRAQKKETVVLTAGASEGMTFVGWSGCSDSTDAKLSFPASAEVTCVAHYESTTPVLL